MALRFIDGFDAGDYAQKAWTVTSATYAAASDRYGVGQAMYASATNKYIQKGVTFSGKAIVGVAVSWTGAAAFFPLLFMADGGATSHIYIRVNVNGSIDIMRGPTTVVASSAAGVISGAGWFYLEASCTLADSGGTVVVRVNNTEVASFTGDTKNGGTSTQVDTVRFTGASGGVYFDDFYACDDSGSAPYNDFLGDCRIHTLVPTGAGASTQMTPSTGSNWACVDELPYSATDYVSSGTAGQKDTYATDDLPAGVSTIHATQLNLVAKKTDAGARSLKHTMRSGGTDYQTAGTALSAADSTISNIRTVDPATSAAWTVSGVNAVEIGAEVV